MKIYQCPEWFVGDVHANQEDFYFIIKTNDRGFTYRSDTEDFKVFGTTDEGGVLNPKDVLIFQKEDNEDISSSS